MTIRNSVSHLEPHVSLNPKHDYHIPGVVQVCNCFYLVLWCDGSCTVPWDFSSLKSCFHYTVGISLFFWTPGEHHLSFVPTYIPISVWRISSTFCVQSWYCGNPGVSLLLLSTERIRALYSLHGFVREWTRGLYLALRHSLQGLRILRVCHKVSWESFLN